MNIWINQSYYKINLHRLQQLKRRAFLAGVAVGYEEWTFLVIHKMAFI